MAQTQQAQRGGPPPGRAAGLPPDLEVYSPFPFKGIKAKGSVTAIDNAEFAWLQNVVWIGDGQLALLGGNILTPLFTAPGALTIASYQFYVLNGQPYFIIFLSDGSATQVNVNTLAQTVVGGPSTFISVGTPATSAPFQGKYLCIATASAYFVWDGTILYQPGSLAPQVVVTAAGLNYSSAPAVTIVGGAGSGATAVATISNGQVNNVTLTNPGSGYAVTDGGFLQVFFTGGGSTNAIARGTATIGGGGVISVQVIDGGTNYTSQPTVTFSGGGASTQATAVASGLANSITTVTVVTPGVGYTGTPSIAFSAPASGDTATAVATVGYHGITGITVTTAGSGYISAPTVQITDPFGFGLGAAATAVMSGGTVASVTITNPGHNYQGAVVNFVGGNPTVAAATIELMPFGGQNPVSGAAIQVFKNRVWMVKGTTRFTSATGDVANFSATAGGVIQQNSDSYLIYLLLGLAQSSGFLYEFGDSSVNSISNPVTTTTNNVTSTSYTVTNVDPQVGCIWPETIQPFGAAIIYANPTGVYGLYGSTVRKISSDIDALFGPAVVAQPLLPSACTATLFGIKFYCLCVFVINPVTQVSAQYILLWDGTHWFAATQPAAITSVASVGFGSQFVPFGSDGKNLFQLFGAPTTALTKTIISKYYGIDAPMKYKRAMRFYISAEQPFTYNVTINTEFGSVVLPPTSYPQTNNGGLPPNPYTVSLTIQGQDVPGAVGRFLGFTLTTTVAINNIDFMGLAWVPDGAYY